MVLLSRNALLLRPLPRALCLLPLAAAVLSYVPASWASGFALKQSNGAGLGYAYAGAPAMAEDASVQFFNPAGMGALPRVFMSPLGICGGG